MIGLALVTFVAVLGAGTPRRSRARSTTSSTADLRHHRPGRPSPDPSPRPAGEKAPGVGRGPRRPHRRGADLRRERIHHRRRPEHERGAHVDWVEGSQAVFAEPRRGRRVRRGGLRRGARAERRLVVEVETPSGSSSTWRSRALRGAEGRLAVRRDHVSTRTYDENYTTRRTRPFVTERAALPTRTREALEAALTRFPTRRS